MTKLNNIRNYIAQRFNNMTQDEFENLAAGDGTLSVLDDALEKFDSEGQVTTDQINELAEFCTSKSIKFCIIEDIKETLSDFTVDQFNAYQYCVDNNPLKLLRNICRKHDPDFEVTFEDDEDITDFYVAEWNKLYDKFVPKNN